MNDKLEKSDRGTLGYHQNFEKKNATKAFFIIIETKFFNTIPVKTKDKIENYSMFLVDFNPHYKKSLILQYYF